MEKDKWAVAMGLRGAVHLLRLAGDDLGASYPEDAAAGVNRMIYAAQALADYLSGLADIANRIAEHGS